MGLLGLQIRMPRVRSLISFSNSATSGSAKPCSIDETTGREEPVAFALYFFNFSTFLTKRGLYLEDLFVRPQARRRGYGRRIMHHLAKTALELDCGRFEWTVLDWNQPAIDFYEKLGARLQEDWRICRLEGEALRAAGLTNA